MHRKPGATDPTTVPFLARPGGTAGKPLFSFEGMRMIPSRSAQIIRRTGCDVCGRPLTFHQQCSGRICDDWRCRGTRLEREMDAHRREAAHALGEMHPEAYPLLVVPYRRGLIRKLPQKRRRAHLGFLEALVTEATKTGGRSRAPAGEPQAADTHSPPALAAAVCRVCAGACCHRGGDRAFLDAAAILHRLAAQNAPEPLQVVATYAGHLPERAFAGSCAYHGLEGCTLPRTLRAAICNRYRCRGLKLAEEWARTGRTAYAYVVVREDNRIRRGAFVGPTDIRHYPVLSARRTSCPE